MHRFVRECKLTLPSDWKAKKGSGYRTTPTVVNDWFVFISCTDELLGGYKSLFNIMKHFKCTPPQKKESHITDMTDFQILEMLITYFRKKSGII